MKAPDELIERIVSVTAVKPHARYDLRHSWWEVTADDGWSYPLQALECAPQIGDQLTVWLRGGVVLEAFRFNQGPIVHRIDVGTGWRPDAEGSSPRGEVPW
jgi:hypothetical protein